jgi:hypothetical protein
MDRGLTLICKQAVMASETPGTGNLFIVDDNPMMRDALSIVSRWPAIESSFLCRASTAP